MRSGSKRRASADCRDRRRGDLATATDLGERVAATTRYLWLGRRALEAPGCNMGAIEECKGESQIVHDHSRDGFDGDDWHGARHVPGSQARRHDSCRGALGGRDPGDATEGIQVARWHREAERYVEGSGIAYTFLRPNYFMDNFIHYHPPDKTGNIYLPWGQGACSCIDARDIAAVASLVLTTARHTGKEHALSGPEPLTVAQAAAAIGEVSGRTIRYVDVSDRPSDDARHSAPSMDGRGDDAALRDQ